MAGRVTPPALLVLAVGNPSRGDDALGPALLQRLRRAGVEAAGEVELLTDFQLQIEHALDLAGRRAVLFVDAARPNTLRGVRLAPLHAKAGLASASHALPAEAVLHLAAQLAGGAPPAWQLAMEGEHFALGESLSPLAQRHLAQAQSLAMAWIASR